MTGEITGSYKKNGDRDKRCLSRKKGGGRIKVSDVVTRGFREDVRIAGILRDEMTRSRGSPHI
jgi:hypothetical protein